MAEQTLPDISARPKVRVIFKRSSSKDGSEGFDIEVSEDATDYEANRVMKLALRLRDQANEALGIKTLSQQLEESIDAEANRAAAGGL